MKQVKMTPEAMDLAHALADAVNASPCDWETKIATLHYILLKVLEKGADKADRADIAIWLLDRLSHVVNTGRVATGMDSAGEPIH